MTIYSVLNNRVLKLKKLLVFSYSVRFIITDYVTKTPWIQAWKCGLEVKTNLTIWMIFVPRLKLHIFDHLQDMIRIREQSERDRCVR